ncbi:MAG: thermonuclease family protein [Hyphococcus sp.]
MRRREFLTGATAAAAWPLTGNAADQAVALSGDRFRFEEQDYQLADIRAPSGYDLYRDSEPFFEEARAIFQRLLSETAVDIVDAGPPTRWGARVVRAALAGGDYAALRLISAGAARVAPKTEDVDVIDALLSAEVAARDARRGLWSLPAYRPFDAARAGRAIGGFHIVEGRVLRARGARGRFYLNFGEDYREDFTVTAPMRLYRRWRERGFDLAALEGARIRARGFVIPVNGPSIELAHQRQVERLETVSDKGPGKDDAT